MLHILGGALKQSSHSRVMLLVNAVGFGAVSFPGTVAGALANTSLPLLRCGLV